MGLFAEVEFATLLALAALVLTIVILLRRSHRYLARQQSSPSPLVHTPRSESRDRARQSGTPDQMLRWEVEMHETARELSGQLNSKMSALESLIREADRAAERLESAIRAARLPADRRPAAAAQEAASPVSCQPGPPRPQPANQAEALQSSSAGRPASVNRGPGQPDTERRAAVGRRQEEIYLLADYGLNALEIAQRLGTPVGEVGLTLSLRDKR